ncbi:hypothetical protein QBC41DRAFT_157277 [Cercophora samala]|uniref:Uncharacterized protein n=1 Tax=Cercophora samala TaxID=330535 RepID=A0AA39Z8A3_9PEZI|nr:hypothetical protein QBC41DRAFT_157277 [Cercophora samala]
MAPIVFDMNGITALFRQLDQKSYSVAAKAGQAPHISLHMRKDGLHVQSNADDASDIFQPFSSVQRIKDVEKICVNEVLRMLDPRGLLFLYNIESYDVAIFDDLGIRQWAREAKTKSRDDLVILETVTASRSSKWTHVHRFHCLEGDTKWTGEDRVMIAFPVDQLGSPLVEAQDLFCFMATEPWPYKFLLHVDGGHTSLSEEHRLNEPLARTIADCLYGISAIPSLEFTWMRYLPDPRSTEKYISALIATCLSSIPLLLDQNGNYSSISQLSVYSENQLDSDGSPLIPAINDTTGHLSSKYKWKDQQVLFGYGLRKASTKDMLARVRALTNSNDWNKFVQKRDRAWHSRVGSWASEALGHEMDVNALGLLSHVSGSLERALPLWKGQGKVIYLPDIDGVPLPQDLPIAMLDSESCSDPADRTFYASLGAVTANTSKVVRMILDERMVPLAGKACEQDIDASNLRLRFLYEKGLLNPRLTVDLPVFDQRNRLMRPRTETIYLSASSGWSEEGGLSSLQDSVGYEDIEAATSFLHPIYLKKPPMSPFTWEDFLCDTVGASRELRIFDRQHKEPVLSAEFLFVAEHKPEWVLDRLHDAHRRDMNKWANNVKATNLVKELDLACANGMTMPLCETILPLPSLLTACSTLLDGGEPRKALPFLPLTKPLVESDGQLFSSWKLFAGHFGVIHSDDSSLGFTLAMLKALMYEDAPPRLSLTQTVVQIYLRISRQKGADVRKVRAWFDDNPGLLYTPQLETQGRPVPPIWGFRQGSEETPVAVARQAWGPVVGSLQPVDQNDLTGFFRDTLGLSDDLETVDLPVRLMGSLSLGR